MATATTNGTDVPTSTVPSTTVVSSKTRERPDFKDTWGVFVPVNTLDFWTLVHRVVIEEISPKDLIRDPVIKPGSERYDVDGWNWRDSWELDPHIILHTGLGPLTDKLECSLKSVGKFTVHIEGLHRFTNPPKMIEGKERSWDVLMCNLPPKKNKVLFDLHKQACVISGKDWHFAEYVPHVTLAYTKFGAAYKYTGIEFGPIEIEVDHLMYQKYRDNTKPVRIDLQ